MLPRDNERDTDFEDALTRRSYRPVKSIAVERETAREKESQILVDNTIQFEQEEFKGSPVVQEHPGEIVGIPENKIEDIVISDPQKLYHPVKVPPTLSTVTARLKNRMGVAEIRARTRGEAVKSPFRIQPTKVFESAFGLPIEERSIKNTPVKSLNLLDQFFNWLNAFLS
jgi:hypothetical protein